MRNCPVLSENAISLKSFTTSGFHNVSASSSTIIPALWGKEYDIDAPFGVEHSIVSFSMFG